MNYSVTCIRTLNGDSVYSPTGILTWGNFNSNTGFFVVELGPAVLSSVTKQPPWCVLVLTFLMLFLAVWFSGSFVFGPSWFWFFGCCLAWGCVFFCLVSSAWFLSVSVDPFWPSFYIWYESFCFPTQRTKYGVGQHNWNHGCVTSMIWTDM